MFHSLRSRGFQTIQYGYHSVTHWVLACGYFQRSLRNGNLAMGRGISDTGHLDDFCSNCMRLA